jgi:hypothetical protein
LLPAATSYGSTLPESSEFTAITPRCRAPTQSPSDAPRCPPMAWRMVNCGESHPFSFCCFFLTALFVLQLANCPGEAAGAGLYAPGRSYEGGGCSPRPPALVSDRGDPSRAPLFGWGLLQGVIFYILALFWKKIHVRTLKNFNVIFGPFARRHSQWRRGNIARRHRLWRRGACYAGTNGRRGTDVAPTWNRARRHRSWRRALLCTQNLSSSVGRAQGF